MRPWTRSRQGKARSVTTALGWTTTDAVIVRTVARAHPILERIGLCPPDVLAVGCIPRFANGPTGKEDQLCGP